jgi:DNA helicase-2/ATP-dependent DNA helicase PcrA
VRFKIQRQYRALVYGKADGMNNILQGLSASQCEAVTATEGFVRVIAGAGSGKTRALAHRFAYLVNDIGILPGNILCVTFTNKASNEMRQRIHNLTGDNDTGYINTFHGFCVSILQEDSSAVQYPKSFLVLDNSDIDSMLKIIYEERGLTLRDMTFANARDMIEIRKIFREPEYYLDMISMSLEDLHQKYLDAACGAGMLFFTDTCIRRKNVSVLTTTTSLNFPCTSLSGIRK